MLLGLTLSGATCHGTMPDKPEVDIGMVSDPEEPDPAHPERFHGCIIAKPDGTVTRLTFRECDKYVAIEPAQFSAFIDYLLAVEQIAAKGCKTDGPLAPSNLRAFLDRYALLLRGR